MNIQATKSQHLTLFFVPWASLLAAIIVGGLFLHKTETVGAWVLIVSALIFGLPHGACDFWILQQTIKGQDRRQKIFLILAVYLGLVLITIWFWLNFAALSLFAFLLLTAWHFGSGDAVWTSDNFKAFIWQAVGRGLLIIAAPLFFYPHESRAVLMPLAKNDLFAEVIWNFAPSLLIVAIVLQILAAATAPLKIKIILLIENVLLLLLFALTTPLFAVAIYLIGVHSWRHLWRLESKFPGKLSLQNSWQVAVNFHLRALPFTLLALAGLVLIFWLWRVNWSDLSSWTTAYLILLSALTVPHAALVFLMELKTYQPVEK